MAAAADLYRGLLVVVTLTSILSQTIETMTVSRGQNITSCNMNCTEGYMSLYRESAHNSSHLLDLTCKSWWYRNYYKPRLHLDNTGCWTLTDARKDDSGVYRVVNHVNGENRTFTITVLDPGSSRPTSPSGESSSLDPRFFWLLLPLVVVLVVISILLVKRRNRCKTQRREDAEMTVTNGRLNSSSSETDPPGDQEGETQEKKPLTWICKIWRTWKKPEYEQTAQRDEEAQTPDGIQVTPPEQRRQ